MGLSASGLAVRLGGNDLRHLAVIPHDHEQSAYSMNMQCGWKILGENSRDNDLSCTFHE